jgi:hypothetical protein
MAIRKIKGGGEIYEVSNYVPNPDGWKSTKPYQHLGESIAKQGKGKSRFLKGTPRKESEFEKPYQAPGYTEMQQDDQGGGEEPVPIFQQVLVSCERGDGCGDELWCLAKLKGDLASIEAEVLEGELIDFQWSSRGEDSDLYDVVFFVNPDVTSHSIRVVATDTEGNEGSATIGITCTILEGPTDGLVAYWPLNESSGSTAYDEMSYKDVSLNNMEDADWQDDGDFGRCLNFDGSPEYGSCNGSFSGVFQGNHSFSFWYDEDTNSHAFWGTFDSSGPSPEHGCILLLTSLKPHYRAAEGSNDYSKRTTNNPTSRPGTNWHHVVFTMDVSTNTLHIYVDGSDEALTTVTVSPGYTASNNSPSGNAYLGCYNLNNGTPTYHYNGRMAEFRVYNRVLTSTEVTTLFNLNDPLA